MEVELTMYAGITEIVDIPTRTDNGYCAILKTGYVYWVTDSVWDKKKKKTIDKRVSIGKLAPGDGKMYPNNKYEELFSKQKNTHTPEPDSTSDNNHHRQMADKFDINMAFGPYAVMKEGLTKIGALSALKSSFPKLWFKIIAKALHPVVTEDSTAQLYSGWAFDNYAGIAKNMTDSEISKLYKEIGADESIIRSFFNKFQKEFHILFPQASESVVAFDSTNQVTESRNLSQAKYGKSKTGEALPVINTAMYVDQTTGIPIWYEHFDGNILDKSQTPYSVEKAASLGYQKLFLMMDRGYFSAKTINALQKQKIGFGMMMPELTNITTNTIKEYRDTIRNNPKYLIPEQDIFGCSTEVTVAGHNLYAFVFYDDNTAKEERDNINSKLRHYLEEIKTRKNYSNKMSDYFKKRAIIVSKAEKKEQNDAPNFTYVIDHELLKKAYDEAGFFMILSNRPLSPQAIICIGRNRDKAEKAFRRLKSHFSLRRSYCHSDASYAGKMFVSFISLLMLSSFAWFCKGILQGGGNATTASLISELHRYKMIKKSDGTWMPAYALNRQQKDIFLCLGITEEKLESDIRGLNL